jgi:hypothetical protein
MLRYEGDKSILQEIEAEIRNKTMCYEYKAPTRDRLFGVESAVNTIILEVMDINYIFPVRIFYDNRPNSHSIIDIRDNDVWKLCKIAPNILKLLAKLDPQINEKQALLEGKSVIIKEKEATA